MTNRQEQGAPARGERWGSPRAQARPERLVRCWLLRMSRGAMLGLCRLWGVVQDFFCLRAMFWLRGGNAGDLKSEKEKAQFRPVLFRMVTYCGNRYELCI